MAGIKNALTDILTKLHTIQVKNAEGQYAAFYTRIFNNQLSQVLDGSGYSWPRPAAFVEIVSPASFEIIGLGFRSADLGIKIHIIHDFYNDEGNFEQDLVIFDLRDQVIMALSQFCPTACGPLNCISEYQDYNHGNLYHYVCAFFANLTASKGSKYDPDAGNFDESIVDNLDLSTVKSDTGGETPGPTSDYIIPQTH